MEPAIVILTGAGISKESGLDTFRDAGGTWAHFSLEDVCTPQGFARNPALVYEFYNTRRREIQTAEVQPNAAHEALARLEAEWPGPVFLVTQNVDNLHERAGSKNLIHMHGELCRALCTHCEQTAEWLGDMSEASICPSCGKAGGIRPDIVWFGEMPYHMERIYTLLETCGLFMSIGTSGVVYPAAGFVQHVRNQTDARTVEINLEPSEGASAFLDRLYGPATQIVPAFVDDLLSQVSSEAQKSRSS